MTCDGCGHMVCSWLPSCPHCDGGVFKADKADVLALSGLFLLIISAIFSVQLLGMFGGAVVVVGFILHFIMKRNNDHPDLSYIRRWKYLSD